MGEDLKSQIKESLGSPKKLEELYCSAQNNNIENDFKNIIKEAAISNPNDKLIQAWFYRLGLYSDEKPVEIEESAKRAGLKHWISSISISIISGIIFIFLAGGKPPFPIPVVSRTVFWQGWSLIVALAILSFLAINDNRPERRNWYGVSAVIAIVLTVIASQLSSGKNEQIPYLIAIHLPFVIWATVGLSGVIGYENKPGQIFGFLFKSLETLVTAGVYVIAGMIFTMLTLGIFGVLGITFTESFSQTLAAWGIGVIPILALASVYEPSLAPQEQNWQAGLARLLRILTRLMLPLAFGVLAIYVFWFIPIYFLKPFQEREVLIIYNATIMAVLALIAVAVPGFHELKQSKYKIFLRLGLNATALMTLLFNIYAFSAILARTINGGLTPNRQAVLGWNIITALILGYLLLNQFRKKSEEWEIVYQHSIGLSIILPVLWAVWVIIGLPLIELL